MPWTSEPLYKAADIYSIGKTTNLFLQRIFSFLILISHQLSGYQLLLPDLFFLFTIT